MVRFSDAHAWCEIYDGDGAWFRVDPTPAGGAGDPLEEDEPAFEIAVDDGWLAFIDSLRVLWYRRVVEFDENTQSDIMASLKERLEIFHKGTESGLAAVSEAVKNWFRGPWDGARLIKVSGGLLLLTASLFLIRCLGWRVLPYMTFYQPRIRLDPVRRQAGVLLRRLEQKAGRGEKKPSGDSEEVTALRWDLQVLRYGSPEERMTPGRVFRRARKVLRRSTRR